VKKNTRGALCLEIKHKRGHYTPFFLLAIAIVTEKNRKGWHCKPHLPLVVASVATKNARGGGALRPPFPHVVANVTKRNTLGGALCPPSFSYCSNCCKKKHKVASCPLSFPPFVIVVVKKTYAGHDATFLC
jgi:hypothetical protein